MTGRKDRYSVSTTESKKSQEDIDFTYITEESYQRRVSSLQNNLARIYEGRTHDIFLNRLIKHLGTHDAKLPKGHTDISQKVRSQVDDLLTEVKKDQRFDGTTIPIGSSAEGTKVKSPNEFDFLLVLNTVTGNDIRVESVRPKMYKVTDPDKIPQCYCEVYILDEDARAPAEEEAESEDGRISRARLWSSNSTFVSGEKKLLSSCVQREFQTLVRAAIAKKFGNLDAAQVAVAGPAISVYLDQMDAGKGLIKVDLSIAIKLDVCQLPTNVQALVENTASLGIPNHDCYLISSGDYWKISLCLAEKEYISSLDERSRIVYKALKVLRDEIRITHELEDPQLSSYPLKVSFIKDAMAGWRTQSNHASRSCSIRSQRFNRMTSPIEDNIIEDDARDEVEEEQVIDDQQGDGKHLENTESNYNGDNGFANIAADTSDVEVDMARPSTPPQTTIEVWKKRSQYHHAISILQQVDVQGSSGTLSSCFLKKNPILRESDRSFLEARRIAVYLHNIRTEYKYHGLFHTGLFILLFLCNIACAFGLGFICFFHQPVLSAAVDGKYMETFPSDDMSAQLVIHLLRPMSIVSLCLCIAGTFSVVGFKWVKKNVGLTQKPNVIYIMYFRMIVYYILFSIPVVVSVVCAGLWVECLDMKTSQKSYCVSSRSSIHPESDTDYIIYHLILATEAGYITVPSIIFLHTIITLSLTKCRPGTYMWEWVFFDKLCKCPSLDCTDRGQEEEDLLPDSDSGKVVKGALSGKRSSNAAGGRAKV